MLLQSRHSRHYEQPTGRFGQYTIYKALKIDKCRFSWSTTSYHAMPLLSLYGIIIIIYVRWYKNCLPEATESDHSSLLLGKQEAWRGRLLGLEKRQRSIHYTVLAYTAYTDLVSLHIKWIVECTSIFKLSAINRKYNWTVYKCPKFAKIC